MKKILAIDDQKDNLATLRAVIKGHLSECEVITALSGKEGIEIAIKEQPDVILLDIIMPKMDGYEVCRKLKANHLTTHIPIILVTAIKTDPESRVKGLNFGADAFISKPIEAIELTAQINVMLRIKAAEDKLRAEKGKLIEIADKKTAELIENEKQFRLIAENTIDNIAITSFDLKAKYLYVSPSIKSVLGYDAEDLLGKSFFNFVHPEDKKALYPVLVKYVNQKIKNLLSKSDLPLSQTIEFRFMNKAGDWLQMQSIVNVVDKKLLAVTRDITAQKKAEEAIKESEEKYKALYENAPLSYQSLNEDGSFKDVNPIWLTTLGYDREEVIGKFYKDFLHPDWQAHFEKNFPEFKRRGYVSDVQFKIRHKKGHYIDISFEGCIGYHPDGSFKQTYCVFKDITEQKKAEKDLLESKNQYQALFNQIADPVAVFDQKTKKFLNCNSAMLAKYGYTLEEFLEMTPMDLHPEDEDLDAILKNIEDEETSSPNEYLHQAKNGTIYHVETHTQEIIYDNHKAWITIIRDISERKKIENNLKKSEQYYRGLFENSHDAIIIFTPDEEIVLDVNQHACNIYGFSRDEFIGMSMISLSQDSVKGKKHIKSTLYNGYYNGFETTQFKKDGSPIFVEVNASVIEFAGQTAILSNNRDITTRKQAEKASIENAEKYRALYTSTNDGIFLMKGHAFISCNSRALEIYGCDKDNFIGHTPAEFSPEIQPNGEQSASLAAQKIDAALTGNAQTFEWLHHKKNGTPFNAEVTLTKMALSDGDYVHALVRDITSRKRSEQIQKALYNISNAVVESESLEEFIALIQDELGGIIDTTNFFIAFYNKDDDTFFSPFMSDEKDDFDTWPAGKTMSSYVVKTTESLFVTEMDLLRMESEGKIDIVGTLPKCGIIVPLRYEGETTGVFAVQSYTDKNAYTQEDLEILEFVSDQISLSIHRKNAEQNLKDALRKATESDRLKSTFLATMSHELRTPLNAIIGFSDIIDRNLSMDEILQFSQTINDSGNHLLNIVEDLFDITLIESGQIKIEKEEIPLIPILNNVHKIITAEQDKTGKSNLDLKLLIPPKMEDLIINTDRSKFKQVLINLLKNAIKFTAKGEVSYGFEEEIIDAKPFLKFFVKDTGIGIRENQQELIFDMFRQADETYTTAHGGTGIGLSITKKLTELMGGNIWLSSERGRGSTFYFTIPNERSSVLIKKDTTKGMENQSLKTKTILIAEDVDASYQLIEAMLSNLEVKIIWAKDGEDAIKLCEENPQVDLILMDINMPILNGYDATKTIKEMRPELPIIAQTAYAIIGDREKSLEAGCDDYISKPIKKESLIKIINKYIK